MTELQHHTAAQADTTPTVWILSKGEMNEGGRILGVFLDRAFARDSFIAEAVEIDNRFGIDTVEPDPSGALRVEGGCDWVDLVPHSVVTRTPTPALIPGDRISGSTRR